MTTADGDQLANAVSVAAASAARHGMIPAARRAGELARNYCSDARSFANASGSPEFEYGRLLQAALVALELRPGYEAGQRRQIVNVARAIISQALQEGTRGW